MTNVLIIGGSGMLGSMMADYLSHQQDLSVRATVRTATELSRLKDIYPSVTWELFEYDRTSPDIVESLVSGSQYVLNAIGITKPLIRDDNPAEIERAVAVNALLPHDLATAAASHGARVLQIATDCVYSGAKGAYTESDTHDALDVYGKTKSLGETWLPVTHHLRCSIIGPEPKDFKFLIEWFRRQPQDARVNGFLNHQWNGVTTLQFARLCVGVIRSGMSLPHLQHVVPAASISKAEMLHVFAEAYDRSDININDTNAGTVIDRTLSTNSPEQNEALWKAAGYAAVPTVPEMIREAAAYPYRAAAQAARV